MNFKSVLSRLTTPQVVKDEQEAKVVAEQVNESNKQAEILQIRSQWLTEPMTNDLLDFLNQSYNYNITRAKELAAENSPSVSKYLIQASAIEKVIYYVRNGNISQSKS